MVFKRLIVQAFTMTIVFFLSFNIVDAGSDPNVQVQDLIDQYNQRLNSIQQMSKQETDLYSQLSDMNRQIYEYDRLIGDLQPKIAEVTSKIQSYQKTITDTQKHIDDRNGLLKNRLRIMYADGNVSYLDVLFSSVSFGDFIDRIASLLFIVQKDESLIGTMTQEKADLDRAQQELQQQKTLLETQQTTLNSAKAEQEKKINERQGLLAQLQQQSQDEKNAAAKEAEELSTIEAQLAPSVQEELKKALANQIPGSDTWLWPVPSSHTITSDFGPRSDGFHAGIDIGAPIGTSIVAVDNGIVLFSGTASGFGHWVVIKHANGLMSIYGHMYGDGIYVTAGQEVKQGQIIAVVGNDGVSTGSHLHFGVAIGITGNRMDYVDPRPYLGIALPS